MARIMEDSGSGFCTFLRSIELIAGLIWTSPTKDGMEITRMFETKATFDRDPCRNHSPNGVHPKMSRGGHLLRQIISTKHLAKPIIATVISTGEIPCYITRDSDEWWSTMEILPVPFSSFQFLSVPFSSFHLQPHNKAILE
jgi:hypothetical protein